MLCWIWNRMARYPPQIYWRRRALALGIAVTRGRGDRGRRDHDRVQQRRRRDEERRQAHPGRHTHTASRGEPRGQDAGGAAGRERSPAPTPTPTAAVTPPPVLKEGDDCPDSTLAVKGITSEPEYVVGDQPKFTMVVTNIGLVACQRDVGAAVLAAYVYSLDNSRLWSNLDCAPSNETLVKTFNPGEQVTTEVTWTGMGSAPDCPLPRQPIGPGTYNLVVQLGNLRSAAVPFVLAEPAPAEAAPRP